MKKLLILIFLIAVLTGCAEKKPAQIAATTRPVWEFTEALCDGTGITVSRLITEEVSCLHDYSVKVSQMRAVEAAQVVVCSGAGFEEFMEDIITDADCVIDASKDVSLLCTDLLHTFENEGHNHEHDPHIWLSPENAKQMCTAICSVLKSIYPEYQSTFSANLTMLHDKLDALQSYGEATLKELSCRNLITFHDGFAYFAESFDLTILKAVEEESGSEASAQELINLIHLVNTEKLPAIFTETNGSTAAAEIIAKETGAKIYTLDMAMSDGSYFNAMYRNIDTVKEALG